MLSYILRRLLQMIVTFFVLTYAIFFFTTRQGVELLHHLSPTALLPSDYVIWLVHILQGNWGYSVRAAQPVTEAIKRALPVTLMLVIPAFILQEALAIGLGVWAAVHHRSMGDRIFSGASFVVASIPQFLLAVEAIIVIAVQFNLLPLGGLNNLALSNTVYGTSDYWAYFHAHMGAAILDIIHHLVLPVGLLALIGAVTDGQIVRLAVIDALGQEYIRAARARGLKRRIVVWKHALRNAAVPLITNIGLQIPNLIFFAALIEYIFNLPGLGQLFLAGASHKLGHSVASPTATPYDYDVISGYFLLLAGIALVASFLADLASAAADPRIRSTGNGASQTSISPLWAVQPLGKLGSLSVTSGRVVVAGVVLAVGVFGGFSLRHLLTPRPSVAGTWVGKLTLPFAFDQNVPHWPIYLALTETQHGVLSSATLTGQAHICEQLYASAPITDVMGMLTGTVDPSHVTVQFTSATDGFVGDAQIATSPTTLDLMVDYFQQSQGSFVAPTAGELVAQPGSLAEYQAQCHVTG